MDFIRSTSEKVKLWRVEHFFPPFFSRSVLIGGKIFLQKNPLQDLLSSVISTKQHWSGKKQGKKVFNSSEFHFFGSTSYEIHILIIDITEWEIPSGNSHTDRSREKIVVLFQFYLKLFLFYEILTWKALPSASGFSVVGISRSSCATTSEKIAINKTVRLSNMVSLWRMTDVFYKSQSFTTSGFPTSENSTQQNIYFLKN